MKDWKATGRNNEKGWWYVNRDGSYPVNNWQQIDSLWYFFDEEGYMKTGWIHWNEKDYFCDESGAMLVNTVTPDGASVGGRWSKAVNRKADESALCCIHLYLLCNRDR